MSPLENSTNIAARVGRRSARHRKTAIFGWLAFVAVAVVVGAALGTKTLDPDTIGVGESKRAQEIIDAGGFVDSADESVLVASETHTAGDPAFRAVLADVVRTSRARRVCRTSRRRSTGTAVRSSRRTGTPHSCSSRSRMSTSRRRRSSSLCSRPSRPSRSRFLALSVSDAAEDVIDVIRAGARGYVTKTISGEELAAAIERVRSGDAAFSPRLAGFVLDAFRAGERVAGDAELNELTPREREVLQLIARG